MAGIKIIAKNKRAYFDYLIEETFEAGLVLQGTEVKSLRDAKCTMTESFCTVDRKMEMYVNQLHISPYEFGTYDNHAETRKRKLLLNRKEIDYIEKCLATKGQSLIPTKIYFKGSRVKIEIALGKGKKTHDKREASKSKDIERKLRQGNYE